METSKTEQVTTQEELKTTQAALATTQNELQTIRLKLEKTMEQLNHSKESLKTMEQQLKLQQENVEKGIMLNLQIAETLATYQSQHLTPGTIFKSINTKQPTKQIAAIVPIEIYGKKLEFPNINEFVRNLKPFQEDKYNLLLSKMETVNIYHVDNKQLIFKLHLPYNYRKLRIRHSDIIASLATKYPDKVVVKNNQLVLFDWNDNSYQIYLQIPYYSNGNSKCFLHQKSENEENLLLGYDWNDININDYKSTSNEVLFHIITKYF